MTRTLDTALQRRRPDPLAARLTLPVLLTLGTLVAPASAQPWRDNHHGYDHHGYDHRIAHHQFYPGEAYPAPPVVYGGPVYAPPPVAYGPAIGINLPGVSIAIP